MTVDTDTYRQYVETISDLDESSRALARDAGSRDGLQDRRDAAVVAISNLGAPRSVVAKLTGMTRGRVQQILDRAGASGATGTAWRDAPEFRRLVEQAIAKRPIPSIGVGL